MIWASLEAFHISIKNNQDMSLHEGWLRQIENVRTVLVLTSKGFIHFSVDEPLTIAHLDFGFGSQVNRNRDLSANLDRSEPGSRATSEGSKYIIIEETDGNRMFLTAKCQTPNHHVTMALGQKLWEPAQLKTIKNSEFSCPINLITILCFLSAFCHLKMREWLGSADPDPVPTPPGPTWQVLPGIPSVNYLTHINIHKYMHMLYNYTCMWLCIYIYMYINILCIYIYKVYNCVWLCDMCVIKKSLN